VTGQGRPRRFAHPCGGGNRPRIKLPTIRVFHQDRIVANRRACPSALPPTSASLQHHRDAHLCQCSPRARRAGPPPTRSRASPWKKVCWCPPRWRAASRSLWRGRMSAGRRNGSLVTGARAGVRAARVLTRVGKYRGGRTVQANAWGLDGESHCITAFAVGLMLLAFTTGVVLCSSKERCSI
jgi:hypothetical protein